MLIEEAIEILEELSTFDYVKLEEGDTAIETVLQELKKKDKIINEMAKYIKKPYKIIVFGSRKQKIEIIKEYFTNKVEKEGK